MANYSVRYDGSANKATSEDGDKTVAAECMSVATFNGESFLAGDNIYFWSNGGDYKVLITVPSSGSVGNHIELIFDANVVLDGEDTRKVIGTAQNYLTFTGNGCEIKDQDNYGFWCRSVADPGPGKGITIDGFVVHDGGYQGICIWDYSDVIVRNCNIYRDGWNALQIGSVQAKGSSQPKYENILIENNWLHDCGHGGLDVHNQESDSVTSRPLEDVTIRYNLITVLETPDSSYDRTAIYVFDQNTGSQGGYIKDVYIYGNVCYRCPSGGIGVSWATQGVVITGSVIVNNTCAFCGQTELGAGITSETSGGIIKNNICFMNNANDSQQYEIFVDDGGNDQNTVDYNCVYNPDHTYLYADTYDVYTHAEYQSERSQQLNGINVDPLFSDADNDDFTLAAGSPCIGAGENLGSPYNIILHPSSTWPDGVVTADQNDY